MHPPPWLQPKICFCVNWFMKKKLKELNRSYVCLWFEKTKNSWLLLDKHKIASKVKLASTWLDSFWKREREREFQLPQRLFHMQRRSGRLLHLPQSLIHSISIYLSFRLSRQPSRGAVRDDEVPAWDREGLSGTSGNAPVLHGSVFISQLPQKISHICVCSLSRARLRSWIKSYWVIWGEDKGRRLSVLFFLLPVVGVKEMLLLLELPPSCCHYCSWPCMGGLSSCDHQRWFVEVMAAWEM